MAHLGHKAAFVLALACIAAPGAAETVRMEGVVPTICEVRGQFGTDDPASADLAVFCNAPDGARLAAYFADGAESGYLVSGASGQVVAMPGQVVDIRRYNTAFRGRETVRITPLAASASTISPAVVFEITPEG